MKNISVFIIAQDEEKRLPATLAAARKVSDDIVVVDSGSTDRTIEVAQSFGARTAYHPWETICIQKHFAQELCREKWVLSLDADEELGLTCGMSWPLAVGIAFSINMPKESWRKHCSVYVQRRFPE